jgi:hypothetical protein
VSRYHAGRRLWHLYWRLPHKKLAAYQILRSDTEKVVAYAFSREMAEALVEAFNHG